MGLFCEKAKALTNNSKYKALKTTFIIMSHSNNNNNNNNNKNKTNNKNKIYIVLSNELYKFNSLIGILTNASKR
jgi:hypothetical protein